MIRKSVSELIRNIEKKNEKRNQKVAGKVADLTRECESLELQLTNKRQEIVRLEIEEDADTSVQEKELKKLKETLEEKRERLAVYQQAQQPSLEPADVKKLREAIVKEREERRKDEHEKYSEMSRINDEIANLGRRKEAIEKELHLQRNARPGTEILRIKHLIDKRSNEVGYLDEHPFVNAFANDSLDAFFEKKRLEEERRNNPVLPVLSGWRTPDGEGGTHSGV